MDPKLLASLDLQDNLTPKLRGAMAGVSAAEGGFLRFGSSLTKNVGGALSHAGNQIRNLVTGPLGMLGLAGGFLGLGTALSGSITSTPTDGIGTMPSALGIASTT